MTRGFTLIEALLGLVLLALTAATAAQFISFFLRSTMALIPQQESTATAAFLADAMHPLATATPDLAHLQEPWSFNTLDQWHGLQVEASHLGIGSSGHQMDVTVQCAQLDESNPIWSASTGGDCSSGWRIIHIHAKHSSAGSNAQLTMLLPTP
ncbi:hypothetical protein LGV61_01420 [Desulfurispirillum indicum]|uniref:Prepilin-type N-terminal cleavage/methylation domain-containing protein n=1 Tax=Desulfurispirillum indicum (strain ATCC BAA-1389 / DSM 22839 / S5) TaxID=653733 RepID=E6W6Q4_DESIS|nr:hypothetical protein [Desulfurispirillum indicum]ADU65054.1 hypothetical protein Selin_0298 [Desulfurispirillum indicum S5]UCZ56962.1 hypothetical protein LGV61_01420 [Desulfurispirillum indicum]